MEVGGEGESRWRSWKQVEMVDEERAGEAELLCYLGSWLLEEIKESQENDPGFLKSWKVEKG